MRHLHEMDLGESFQPFATLQEQFGFVPKLFRAQTLLPPVIEAEVRLVDAVLFKERALSRIQKECILLVLAAASGDTACIALHHQILHLLSVPEQRLEQIIANPRNANLSRVNSALVSFALKLGIQRASLSRTEVSSLGLADEAILEAILTTALGNFLGTLSTGLGVTPDFSLKPVAPDHSAHGPESNDSRVASGSPLRAPQLSAEHFKPFGFFREQFGFVPSVFRAQTLRPDVLEAEAELIRAVLVSEHHLTRAQKNGILRGDGPAVIAPGDVDLLHNQHFTDEQILEAALTTALAHFLSTLQHGMGTASDWPLRDFRRIESEKAHLSTPAQRQTTVTLSVDADAEWVAKVRGGDLNAFEELMNRHSQRVYRTLMGLLGDVEEARDSMQDTFLKAFQHLGSFEGRSKFSTWLMTIASNTAMQRLRDRKPLHSLDEPEFESDEGFRPRQVQSWTEDPEQLYSQTELRSLIESSIMKLPSKYRVVLMLRDIEQLSIEDSAGALGLGIAALKARLLRGRLMLREALAPHFVSSPLGGSVKGVTP